MRTGDDEGLGSPPHVEVTREGDRIRVDLPEHMLGMGVITALLMFGPLASCLGVPLLALLGMELDAALGLALIPLALTPFIGALSPAIQRRVYWTPRSILVEQRMLGLRYRRTVLPLDAVRVVRPERKGDVYSVLAWLEGDRLETVCVNLDSLAARWLTGLIEGAAEHRRLQLQGEAISSGPPSELLELIQRRPDRP